MSRKKTIFLDIDGCIWKNQGLGMCVQLTYPNDLLPGVKEFFDKNENEGNYMVLTTGRKECWRKETEELLKMHGLYWDQLIMGITGGKRILINDRKANGDWTAEAINIERNVGLNEVNIE